MTTNPTELVPVIQHILLEDATIPALVDGEIHAGVTAHLADAYLQNTLKTCILVYQTSKVLDIATFSDGSTNTVHYDILIRVQVLSKYGDSDAYSANVAHLVAVKLLPDIVELFDSINFNCFTKKIPITALYESELGRWSQTMSLRGEGWYSIAV